MNWLKKLGRAWRNENRIEKLLQQIVARDKRIAEFSGTVGSLEQQCLKYVELWADAASKRDEARAELERTQDARAELERTQDARAELERTQDALNEATRRIDELEGQRDEALDKAIEANAFADGYELRIRQLEAQLKTSNGTILQLRGQVTKLETAGAGEKVYAVIDKPASARRRQTKKVKVIE